jgi:IS605 OrfB family transposase
MGREAHEPGSSTSTNWTGHRRKRPPSRRPCASSSLSGTRPCGCGWRCEASPRTTCNACAPNLPKSTHLPAGSTPRPGKPVPTAPGSPSHDSTTTARTTSPARRAIPASSMITGAWSISRRAGSWSRTASTSPSRTAVASVPCGWSGTRNNRLKPSQSSRSSGYGSYGGRTGYYVQFGVQADRRIEHAPTGKQVGIDMGLHAFLTDSDGNAVANPRHLRKAERRLNRLHRRLSRKQKQSQNRKKARKALAKAYLKVQRQREDFARKTASTLVSSHDLIAYEHLQIRNLVKNRKLAKSISDAAWGRFLAWLTSYGRMHDIPVIALEPAFTSQECSGCHRRVKKSLSVRTHICPGCGLVLDRDHNAALNILAKALGDRTGGQSETGGQPRNAWGEPPATLLPAVATGQGGSWNQEPPVLEPCLLPTCYN